MKNLNLVIFKRVFFLIFGVQHFIFGVCEYKQSDIFSVLAKVSKFNINQLRYVGTLIAFLRCHQYQHNFSSQNSV